MTAYYNEIDGYAAQWLRNLIASGLIADGEVDERSIVDVRPDDLRGFTQCHFFAGIAVWSRALRLAGWPDERPVWTGSCPCQPFSAAGKGGGFADERHLWPAFFHLIRERRPDVVLGEQVASKDGLAWGDLVRADLEGEGYAVGMADTCAAGFGAPHIRQRLYWTGVGQADACGPRLSEQFSIGRAPREAHGGNSRETAVRACAPGAFWVADTDGGDTSAERQQRSREQRQQPADGRAVVRLANAERESEGRGGLFGPGEGGETEAAGAPAKSIGTVPICHLGEPGPTNGFWRDPDWLLCRDDKWRPVEAGTFPLAHGITARVGKLRAAGNAIVSEQARGFIEAVMEAT